jgi:hypothetical protein
MWKRSRLRLELGRHMKAKIHEIYSEHFTADDDQMLILGNELLSELEVFPDSDMSRAVLNFLDEELTNANQRALFNLPPVLPPSGTVVPLKKR